MSDEIRLTRRALLQGVAAVVATASIDAPQPLLVADDDVVDGDISEDVDAAPPFGASTKLEAFLKSRGIKPSHLARESGYSRRHLLRLRLGRMKPTDKCIGTLVYTCRCILRETVSASDLFDVTDAHARAIDCRWLRLMNE